MKYYIIFKAYFAQVESNVKNFKTKTDFCCGTCYRKTWCKKFWEDKDKMHGSRRKIPSKKFRQAALRGGN
jgi:hypothetical protein